MNREFSIARILIAIGFALSCFGLLLFLWSAFGGPVAFRAQSYRLTIDVPQAASLINHADVRIGGVSVGKVETVGLDPEERQARVALEIDPRFAPIASDSRAIVREKTLVGETYLELTSGSEDAEPVPDGGHLADAQVEPQTRIDQIFNALDPRNRQAFRIWMRNAAEAVRNRGLDLNDALGNLSPFMTEATYVLEAFDRQQESLRRGIRDSGEFFEGLTSRDRALADAIVSSNQVFEALASRERQLADTIQILPTFERETRLTLNRLSQFADDATPLIRNLRPVARDLGPTLRAIRRVSPDLEGLFDDLEPLIDASRSGLPALAETLEGVRPLLAALDPFLANLNPVLRYIDAYRLQVADFLGGVGAGFAAQLEPIPGQPAPRRTLRVEAYVSPEVLTIQSERPPTNRGDAYLNPLAFASPQALRNGTMFPQFDCENSGGEVAGEAGEYSGDPFGNDAVAPCVLARDFPPAFGGGSAPNVRVDP